MDSIFDIASWNFDLRIAGQIALAVAMALAASYLVYKAVFFALHRLALRSEDEADDLIIERIKRPIKYSFFAIGVTIAAQGSEELAQYWEPLAQFLRPALLGWIAYNLVKAVTAALELRMKQAADPIALRTRRTRLAILSRIASFAIVTLAVGLMLFSIPSVRTIGTTMLASAGLVALAVGAAAQPALKSLIAGLQIALTEPLRIGDLVVVDGHTGRIEEIHMSYITLRIWDQRLVVLPTTRFLDDSFENWSRRNEELTGPVFLHLDPASTIAPIRAEFLRFVSEHELADGRTASLLVTETYPESIELRLTMSARTIADLWDLRCAAREHMLGWLQREMPDALIRRRLDITAEPPQSP